MKQLITILLLTALSLVSHAQSLNWASLDSKHKQMAYLKLGYDFGITTQIGYGHKIHTSKPIWLTLDYSMPMGAKLSDDFKTRLGGQIAVINKNNFILTTSIYSNFRRHQSTFVRMASFGTEISGTLGYYRPKWHIASTIGFDKSIITHLAHSEQMKEHHPTIADGWFLSTGGHWFYGIQAGKTLGKNYFLSLDVGTTNAQGNDVDALLPFYFQVGLVKTF